MCMEEIFGQANPSSDYGVGTSADYLMGTPTSQAWSSMPSFGDYGSGASADYLMGTPTPQAVASTPSFSGYSGGANQAAPSGGGGGGGNTLKNVLGVAQGLAGPALGLAASMYGARSQNNMAQNLNQAQQASYDQYLNALNPPEPVKNAQYQKAVNQILPTASLNQRKIYNELASRGVRGAGLASPTAGMERDVTKAKQNAYLDIYGRYNVPQALPPVQFTPGTSNLIGSSVGDVGTAMLLKQLFG